MPQGKYTMSIGQIPCLLSIPNMRVIMVNLMQHVVNHGTGRAIRAFGFHGAAAGKTGTTNDNTDAWFTGFTPDLVASVWIGFDNPRGWPQADREEEQTPDYGWEWRCTDMGCVYEKYR